MNLRTLKRVGLVLLALAALYAASGFLLAPWLAQRYLPQLLEERLGRGVAAANIRTNPFLLTFEATQVTVEGHHGRPLLTIGRLFADASLPGLWRRRLVLDELLVEGLALHLVLQANGKLNVVEVASHWRDRSGESAGNEASVRVRELTVPGAQLLYTEVRADDPARASIGPIELRARNLSTAPGDPDGSYTLAAGLPQGASLDSQGEITALPGLAAHGELRVQGLQARTAWPFLRDHLRLSDLQASVDFRGRYAFGPDTALRLSEARIDASDVSLTAPGQRKPMFEAGRMSAAGEIDLGSRSARIGELALSDGQVAVRVARDGSSDWTRILADGDGPAADGAAAAAPWSLQIDQATLERMDLHYANQSPGQPWTLGADDLSGQLRLALAGGTRARLVADGVQARWAGAVLRIPGSPVPEARFGRTTIEGGRFDPASRQVSAGKLVLTGAATFVRDAGGDSPQQPQQDPPWRYAIDVLEVPSLDFAFADRSLQPPLQLRGSLQGRARNLAPGEQASFQADVALAGGGQLALSGSAVPDAAQVQSTFKAGAVPVMLLQPLLERVATLELQSGTLSGSGQLRFGAESASLRVQGNFGVSGLLLNEAGSGDHFLSWSQMNIQGASLDLHARQVLADEIIVRQPRMKIVISENRDLNLLQVLKQEDAPSAQGRQPGRERGLSVAVDRIRLRDGEVDFADFSLVLPFSTTVKQLEGTIVDVSSDPSRRASVQASGNIEPYGSARVEGTLLPSKPRQFTDLRVAFDNVPMPPLSPYTATFAGRKVESGRLWLDLDYRVVDGELRGKNDIRLSDFRLGERVQAPNALDIPLDLAVALLTDADGEIHLSVPVTGELGGGARFSVASAVRQAIGNVLQRIVSAPFRALANVFGGKADALGTVEFQPGSARLRPQELEQLDALVRALRERPRLALVVTAPYDPQADVQALRQRQARRALSQALGRSNDAQEDPGPFSFDDPQTLRALERLLRSAAGDEAVSRIRQQFPAADDAGRQALFEAMLARLAAQQPLPDTATQRLAVERAREIAAYLQGHGIDRSRVLTGNIETVSSGRNGEVASKLQVATGAGAG